MKILAVFLIILLSGCIYAQVEISGESESAFVSITKDPPKPPFLEIVPGSLKFIDDNANGAINANEQSYLEFTLKNTGMGPGLNMVLNISEMNATPGLTFDKSTKLGTLDPGKVKSIKVPISSTLGTVDGKASFSLVINELNGFGSDPFYLEVETRAFAPPMVKVVDYKVSSQQGTTIQKRRPFEVQLLVQNIGHGRAENIVVSVPVPGDMFCLSGNETVTIERLDPGEQRLLEYSFVANNNYQPAQINLNYDLSESYRKYAEDKKISLAMNQTVSDHKLVVAGQKEDPKAIVLASLSSGVDKNIPVGGQKNPHRIALIIGNEDYSGNLNAEINVKYARNDAEIFKRYANSVLGVEEINTFYLINATSGEMRREIDKVSELMKRLGSQTELIFYYAGHGLPDENTRIPYLIPVDVDATNLSSAIRLSDVYSKFGNTGAKRVTVFLDACFSGGGRNSGLLAARAVKVKAKEELVSGNMVVFSATTDEQSALPYDNEQHGMFTYFLLKKLQETGGDMTYGEMADYLKNKVSVESLRINGKEQDPVVRVSHVVESSWSSWKLK